MTVHCTIEELSTYIDAELSPEQRRRVDGHVSSCEKCRDRLRGLRSVHHSVRRLTMVEPPPTLGWQVRKRLELEARRPSTAQLLEERLSQLIKQPLYAPLFAMVMALAIISYLLSVGVARQSGSTTRIVASPPGRGLEAPRIEDESRAAAGAASESAMEVPSDVSAAGTGDDAVGRAESLELAGRFFQRRDGVWWERGLGNGEPERSVQVDRPAELPDGLRPLWRHQDETYVLLLDGVVTRLELSPGAPPSTTRSPPGQR
jgi:hypothetical protein